MSDLRISKEVWLYQAASSPVHFEFNTIVGHIESNQEPVALVVERSSPEEEQSNISLMLFAPQMYEFLKSFERAMTGKFNSDKDSVPIWDRAQRLIIAIENGESHRIIQDND